MSTNAAPAGTKCVAFTCIFLSELSLTHPNHRATEEKVNAASPQSKGKGKAPQEDVSMEEDDEEEEDDDEDDDEEESDDEEVEEVRVASRRSIAFFFLTTFFHPRLLGFL